MEPGVSCPADSPVIARYRDTEMNLRSLFGKIIDRAGVERWPKPFMALRASRRTELERSGRFANHVLNDWFGHTGQIAETHYLQVTEDDYSLANVATCVSEGQSEGQSLGQQQAPREITESENRGKTGDLMTADGSGVGGQYTLVDSNH